MSQSWIMKEELKNCYKLFDFSLWCYFLIFPWTFALVLSRNLFLMRAGEIESLFLIEGDWLHFFLFKLKILFFPQLDLESREWINIAPPMKRSLTSKLFFFLLFIFNFDFSSSIARLASSSSSSFSSSTTHYCSDLSSERVLNTTQKTD